MLRLMGVIYGIGFLIVLEQGPALFGSQGLLPAQDFLKKVEAATQGGVSGFWHSPTVFWPDLLGASDTVLMLGGWVGLILSLILVSGFGNSILLFALWALYLSFVNIGQIFYGFGWEMLLLESGFLAIFLVPVMSLRPFQEGGRPPEPVIWMFRWILFRLMFGAGLIKVRGDACWLDLTCMQYHYETQPLPNPLSFYFHGLPSWLNQIGVLFTHFVELVVPWGLFGPRKLRHLAGCLIIMFQLMLILSGNLSWLNYITIAVAFSCFDDRFWMHRISSVSSSFGTRLEAWYDRSHFSRGRLRDFAGARRIQVGLLGAFIFSLSLKPTLNLLSSAQLMNASFDSFHLVNTYGAFGRVTRKRMEVILQATQDPVIGPLTRWKDYEFKCKPGDPKRLPCLLSPYHYKIDWDIWFAAMESYQEHPWLVQLVGKLLKADAAALDLLASAPFGNFPPTFIRGELFEYRFAPQNSGAIWERIDRGLYLPPLSMEAQKR